MLSKGLTEGFKGAIVSETVNRGGFTLKSSHLGKDGEKYHDEYIPARTTGGQEIAESGDEKYTRVYAGGVIANEELKKLGIKGEDVISYLIKKVVELGEKTRLFEDCIARPDGDWQYEYWVTDKFEQVDLVRSLEVISYRGVRVFIHGFEICRVIE